MNYTKRKSIYGEIISRGFLILLFLIVLSGYSFEKVNREISPKEISLKEVLLKEVLLKEVARFGNEEGDGMLGNISGFALDNENNLYISDGSFYAVKKFSAEGKFISTFGKGKGRGPGEFLRNRDIAVDSKDNLYVLDVGNRNISVFNKNNKFLFSKKINLLPSKIVLVKPFVIDVIGFAFTYKGNLIQRYNLKEKESKPILTYCERTSKSNSPQAMRSGNSNKIAKGANGKILFASFSPYQIKVFSEKGKLLKKIEGKNLSDQTDALGGLASGVREITYLCNGIAAVLVQKTKGKEKIQHLDFLNLETGKLLKSINVKKFSKEKAKFLNSDKEGNLYISFGEPFPHIVKYKVEM